MTERHHHRRHRPPVHQTTGGPGPKPKLVHSHDGIRRQPNRKRTASSRALTDRMRLVLAQLSDEPQGAAAIAKAVGLQPPQVSTSLYAIQARGLARKLGHYKGWIATP